MHPRILAKTVSGEASFITRRVNESSVDENSLIKSFPLALLGVSVIVAIGFVIPFSIDALSTLPDNATGIGPGASATLTSVL